MVPAPQNLKSFDALKEIVAALRGPEGCPWDKDQTHQSLTPFAIEEIFELVESIENQDDPAMQEELGDVLFQVALHAQLAEERQAFSLADVLDTLNTKMVRRHPHVFGDENATTKEEVLDRWDIIKKSEKTSRSTVTSHPSSKNDASPFSIPPGLPSLQRAFKIGNKTNKSGFDWSTATQVKEKILEELQEIEEALEKKKNQELVAEEIGDLLFSVAQYARHLGHEPESCLRQANRKFEQRYSHMLKSCEEKKLDFNKLPLVEKEKLWAAAKQATNPTRNN